MSCKFIYRKFDVPVTNTYFMISKSALAISWVDNSNLFEVAM